MLPKNEGLAGQASRLNLLLEGSSPERILEVATATMPSGKLAVVSSFGIESAVMLHLVATTDRTLPVIFLETGWHFPETLAYRELLADHLGLSDVRVCRPNSQELTSADPANELWSTDPDECCRIRKVLPLAAALDGFGAWVSGRKRFHGGERTALPLVESDGARLKFNPLASLSRKEIAACFRLANLPPHPLSAAGYLSIGCLPCSSRTKEGEGVREGRWRGFRKTECGIHR